MFRYARTIAFAALFVIPLLANDPDRDFSGKWILDARSSNGQTQETALNCAQQDSLLKCSATRADGTSAELNYDLNGADTRYSFGEEKRNSKVKWEGAALIVNTIISSPHDYSLIDRWTLSNDLNTLTIGRERVQRGADNEETLVYRREGTAPAAAAPVAPKAFTNDPNPRARPSVLQQPVAAPGPDDYVVHSGTRIPLSLRNAIDTKHSHEGDRVYLTTVYPVVVNNKVVIPKGSYVNGTLTKTRPAGAIGKKGELYIRFDSLTLPNGVTRDFTARLASKDSGQGKVDPKEGTITGERDNSKTAKTTAETTGIGAAIGGIAGAAAGHPLSGVGIGAAAGAAIGLATMMNKHRADVVLPRGTVVEMLLDRDLTYQPSELSR